MVVQLLHSVLSANYCRILEEKEKEKEDTKDRQLQEMRKQMDQMYDVMNELLRKLEFYKNSLSGVWRIQQIGSMRLSRGIEARV